MQFRVLWDQLEACPYREGQTARLPLRLPLSPISHADFDRLLELGDRRSGRMLYRTQCPNCRACEPLRVPVARFVPTRSQRRVLKRNEGQVEVEFGTPEITPDRLNLYNRHKLERGLSMTEHALTPEQYRAWLVDTCAETREVRYRVDGRLVAVSILDLGLRSASSVYHYFDPDESWRSLGVYSALKEIELCRGMGISWYYFGFYVADCAHLVYKASYYPHQRRINGVWQDFNAPEKAGE